MRACSSDQEGEAFGLPPAFLTELVEANPPAVTDQAVFASLSCSKIRMGGCLPRMASSVISTSFICF